MSDAGTGPGRGKYQRPAIMSEPSSDQRQWLQYAGLGTEFFGGLLGCVVLGILADRHFGVAPWGVLIGSGVGLVGSMVNLIRRALRMQRLAESQRRGKLRQP